MTTVPLHYKRYGDHPRALIILHGLLGSGGNWHTLSSHVFSKQLSVYVLDFRNHGRSPHTDVHDYDGMARDVVAFMDEQGIEQAFLLGHSMGGKAAMRLALDYPDRVERLVVADMSVRAYQNNDHLRLIEALLAIDPEQYEGRREIDAALAATVPDAGVRQFLLKNLALDETTRRYRWLPNLPLLREAYPALMQAVKGPHPYTEPALFVRGERSPYIRDEDRPAIRQLFPWAEFVTIPDAGHWLHADQPRAFGEVVLEFLT